MPKKPIEYDEKKSHYIAATAIIMKKGKYLIAKRASWEKSFPNLWTVPGGKLETKDYINTPKSTNSPQWYNIIERLLQREVSEEVGLKIKNIRYLCDLVFLRPDRIPVVTFSMYADWAGGRVVLEDSLTDYAWVTTKEAKKYELIDGIWEELEMLDKILSGKKVTKWQKK
ncbi:TPA: NUDIX domain-containing protein [Candidatus Berkelbacteria bacterium]|uniref:8-oxo-dGTP diphosphatase n=1 Tax=Berkelbacteria bacterium GW2011_GWE1_39_12 TaxID=1618337 RepID=A0A0G4B351_9BACT|nr:MAG: hypothetical protein UT28_C0001G0029 [Berkelbacteria bacterium GW2011_GWE1_39_12]HBO60096.1 NUDIX domain-containing protein [Candidatus Berkelbacteria bacterium]